MRPTAVFSLVALPALALAAACGSSTGPTTPAGNPSAPATATTSATAPSAPAPATSTAPSVPTSTAPVAAPAKRVVDACQVVTLAEASALAGQQLTAGQAEDTNGGKRCTYGAQTTHVLWVQVGEASSPAAANAEWAKEQAAAQKYVDTQLPAGLKATLKYQSVSGLGDRAETGTWSADMGGQTLRLSAIYLLKGASFLAFGEAALDKVPTTAALEAQARTSLARLP